MIQTNKLHYYVIILLLIGVCAYLYNDRNDITNRSERNIEASNDTIKYYKNKYGEVVASKLALEYTEKELKSKLSVKTDENKRLSESLKKYKKVIAVVESKQEVKIDTVYVPFKTPINCDFNKFFDINDDNYKLGVNISNLGFKLKYLELSNNQNTIIGWKGQGLFKGSKATVEITNSNPYFNQVEMKPIIITYPRKIYEKWYITIPTGYILGKIF
jgi:hypothetical protein